MEEETGIPINIFEFLNKSKKSNEQEKSLADSSISVNNFIIIKRLFVLIFLISFIFYLLDTSHKH